MTTRMIDPRPDPDRIFPHPLPGIFFVCDLELLLADGAGGGAEGRVIGDGDVAGFNERGGVCCVRGRGGEVGGRVEGCLGVEGGGGGGCG